MSVFFYQINNILIIIFQSELPLPPTEILRTWANITESRRNLGFNPQTNLVDGNADQIEIHLLWTALNSSECLDSYIWFDVRVFRDALSHDRNTTM